MGVMSIRLLLVLAVAGLSGCIAARNREENDRKLGLMQGNPEAAFEEWVEEYGRDYVKGTEEWETRHRIWLSKLHKVVEHNKKGESYWLAINEFSDYTREEYSKKYLGAKILPRNLEHVPSKFTHASVDMSQIPDAVDWRESGAVTEVKNQFGCGACWAFVTTGVVEGITAIKTGELTSLSEQELVDCDRDVGTAGCEGGDTRWALGWVKEFGGLTTEGNYPYVSGDLGVRQECSEDKTVEKVASITDVDAVPEREEDLIRAVSQQPVGVHVDFSDEMDSYAGGVFSGECSDTVMNHGVLIVGYNLNSRIPYWIVKNSYGAQWGEDGYFRFPMDGTNLGKCGIGSYASYPLKDDSPIYPRPQPASHGQHLACDSIVSCNKETETCCCSFSLYDFCIQSGCCPHPDGICCPDEKHCCPKKYPNCMYHGDHGGICHNDMFYVEWSDVGPSTSKPIAFNKIYKLKRK